VVPKNAARAGLGRAHVFGALGMILAFASSACSSVEEVDGEGVVVLSDDVDARLGQVHVILQPMPDPIGVEPQLDISARFVHYRGLDEDSVRTRLDMGVLPYEKLSAGSCVPTEALEGVELRERSATADRELLLVDAGNVSLQLGTWVSEVPLVLLPDLLPYMSGIEYQQVTDVLPTVFVYDDVDELGVEIEGSGDDEIPPMSLKARLPAQLDLEARRGLDPSVLELRWRGDRRSAEDAPLIVRIAGYVGSEPLGAEVTCAVQDRGFFRLDLAQLRGLGLGVEGEGLHLRASRYAQTTFDAGDFVGSEFIVEIRDSQFIVLR